MATAYRKRQTKTCQHPSQPLQLRFTSGISWLQANSRADVTCGSISAEELRLGRELKDQIPFARLHNLIRMLSLYPTHSLFLQDKKIHDAMEKVIGTRAQLGRLKAQCDKANVCIVTGITQQRLVRIYSGVPKQSFTKAQSRFSRSLAPFVPSAGQCLNLRVTGNMAVLEECTASRRIYVTFRMIYLS